MRLVEIRLLEGPNVYRLAPVVKVEVAVGRARLWQGSRTDTDGIVHLGRAVPAREWPDQVADLVAWTRRLRVDHGEHEGPVAVHVPSDAGRWVVTWPWAGAERARLIAEAAFDLAARSVSPARKTRLTGTQARIVDRWQERIAGARGTPPAWIRDEARRMPAISITGTNGKSTVSRLITHILLRAGRTSARRPPTGSWSTSGWSIPATGPAPAAPRSSCAGATSTWPSWRPPGAAWSCVAWATN